MIPLFGKKAAKPINYFTDIMARFVICQTSAPATTEYFTGSTSCNNGRN